MSSSETAECHTATVFRAEEKCAGGIKYLKNYEKIFIAHLLSYYIREALGELH
jgi:hypothetical protein